VAHGTAAGAVAWFDPPASVKARAWNSRSTRDDQSVPLAAIERSHVEAMHVKGRKFPQSKPHRSAQGRWRPAETSARETAFVCHKAADAASALFFFFLIAFLITVSGFRSASGCELPWRVISSGTDPNKQMREFRVSLQAPDFSNIPSVKQHHTFATILTRILLAEVSSRSRGQCNIMASTSLFPDLRIGVYYNAEMDQSDKCSNLVKDILVTFSPSQDSINQITASIAGGMKYSATHAAGYMSEANNALNDVLKYIYEQDSVMHALVSVSTSDFESALPSSFLDWLGVQRFSDRMALTPLVMCNSADEISNAERSNETMPYSNVIAPQAIALPLPENQSSPPRLHYLVVVGGDSGPENAVVRSAATDKYCHHEHEYPSGPTGAPFLARTRCLTEIFHNTDTWIALFCDPRDCSSAELAQKVAAGIANDPDVVALSKAFAKHGQARGPYLVKVISTYK
jgi:hypothetical protein